MVFGVVVVFFSSKCEYDHCDGKIQHCIQVMLLWMVRPVKIVKNKTDKFL